MSPFGSKKWKVAATLAYVGMVVGLITVTAVMPLAFIALGETDMQDLALHCLSMKSIQYWLVGIGLVTFLCDTIAVVGSMTSRKGFRIFVTLLLSTNISLIIALLVWGMLASDSRKSYFQETWNDLSLKTKYRIQEYYSCCGFDSYTEWTAGRSPISSSCFAIESSEIYWPDGCYARAISASVPAPTVIDDSGASVAIGNDKANVFFASFIASMSILIIVQIVNLVAFLIALCGEETPTELAAEQVTFENGPAIANHTTSNGIVTTGEGEKQSSNVISVSKSVDSPVNKTRDEDVIDAGADNAWTGKKKPWYEAVPSRIVSAYTGAFQWLGVRVGHHPKTTIVLSLMITGVMSFGFLQRWEPLSTPKSFLADDSEIIREYDLYLYTFVDEERENVLIIEDESDVLSSDSYRAALNLDTSIKNLVSNTGQNFSSICLNLAGHCKQRSLFEFWNFDQTQLSSLSKAQILEKINTDPLISPVFGGEVDIEQVLGGITRDAAGNVQTAKAHLFLYATTSSGGDWEDQFISQRNEDHGGANVYVATTSSWSNEANKAYLNEMPLLFVGFMLTFLFIFIMTGKFSLLEHRVYVALMGVTAAGLSMAAGIGLASSFGLSWSVLHLLVPFVVLGIGVDDMFVILQAWNYADEDKDLKDKSVAEKAGYVLQSAGLSITVTSVTDLVAFAVGAASDFGMFASFSVYVAICIIVLFFFECTFFMACVVLDQRRKENRYDACLFSCYKHGDSYKRGKCADREIFLTFFEEGLGRIVTKLPFAIVSILVTFGLSGFMAWGFYNLQVNYDPDWYMPTNSYARDFNNKYDEYFAGGASSAAYVINADFYAERAKLHTMYQLLEQNPDVDNKYLYSWFEDFVSWAAIAKNITNVYADNAFSSSTAYYSAVQEFLASSGKAYSSDAIFNDGVQVASRFPFRHRVVPLVVDNADIMIKLREDFDALGFNGTAFPFGSRYFNFEIVRIIRNEVYRNLGITLACVLVMVLPMLASIQMTFWVVLCVVLTIVDVAGSMYFAGLTIEASTIITLLLSVGLAVDYAAHIGHKFLCLKGSRKQRARVTVSQMGPAVFNGGFSTFLALVLLSSSDAYFFRVFFIAFGCVVGYGLWNGLVFLPCVLALIGPPANVSADEARLSERHYNRKRRVASKNVQQPPVVLENLDNLD